VPRAFWFCRAGATVWLVQQWSPDTRFALLDKPAVAPNKFKGHAPLDFQPFCPLNARSRFRAKTHQKKPTKGLEKKHFLEDGTSSFVGLSRNAPAKLTASTEGSAKFRPAPLRHQDQAPHPCWLAPLRLDDDLKP